MAEEEEGFVLFHPLVIFLLAFAFVLMLFAILRDTGAIARLQALFKPTESHVEISKESAASLYVHDVERPVSPQGRHMLTSVQSQGRFAAQAEGAVPSSSSH